MLVLAFRVNNTNLNTLKTVEIINETSRYVFFYFKRNKRRCEKNAQMFKAERLVSELCNNDFKNFWKDIEHMNNIIAMLVVLQVLEM